MIKHRAPFERSHPRLWISFQTSRNESGNGVSVVQRHRRAIPSAPWCEGSPCQLRGFAAMANGTEHHWVRNGTATAALGLLLPLTTNNHSSSTPTLFYIFYAKYETAVEQ